MTPEEVAKKARKSISSYCYDDCKAYCCRKGYLTMNLKEACLVTNNFTNQNTTKIIPNGRFSLDLNKTCPRLVEHMCTIHKKRNRPSACKEFPIFITGNTVLISSRCPAVKENKLYPYIKQWKKMGCNIMESSIDF